MNIAIVDDELEARELLAGLVERFLREKSMSAQIHKFPGGEEFLASDGEWDIVFMDVYMNGMTGVEAASEYRKCTMSSILVFCTSSMDHMPEAFSCRAFDYVFKPAAWERVSRIMADALRLLPSQARSILLKDKSGMIELPVAELISAETSGHYISFKTSHMGSLSVRMTLPELSAMLEGDKNFLIINRGILVNMDFISVMKDGECRMSTGDVFPIRTRDAAALTRTWNDFFFEKLREQSRRQRDSEAAE